MPSSSMRNGATGADGATDAADAAGAVGATDATETTGATQSRRAQTSPVAALVACFAVVCGVSIYAGVLDDAVPSADRDLAGPTLDRVTDAASDAGVVVPKALDGARRVGPDGYAVNVSVRVGPLDDRSNADTYRYGPTAPPTVDTAARDVSVRVAPGRIRTGRVVVRVWT